MQNPVVVRSCCDPHLPAARPKPHDLTPVKEKIMSWTFVQGLSTARSLLAAATCDGPAPQSGVWVYAIGGMDASGSVVKTVEAYDTSTKSWSTPPPIKPMLTARARLAAASGPD